MTTAAAHLAELGIEMPLAQAYLMAQVQAGNAAGVLAICDHYDITAAMLGEIAGYPNAPVHEAIVHEYFRLNGLDSSVIISAQTTVQSVSSPTVTEGASAGLTVTLSGATVMATEFSIGLDGTASMDDFSDYHFSNGVTLTDTLNFKVPVGVSSFTVTMMTHDDTTVESAETFALTVGGVTGTATINDNDTQQPPAGIALMPEELEGMLPIVQLNDETGALATATLRAEIIAGSNETAYWSLFEAGGYVGAEDEIFTNAEAGWSIGDQPATPQTLESVFYGTLINALQAVDGDEMDSIGAFVFTHQVELGMNDKETYAELVELLIDAFEDTPNTGHAFTEGMIAEAIVEVGIELVGMAQDEPSIFHGLLNWL